jgi:hypothetical protein
MGNQCEKFGLERDRDLEMLYLMRSAAHYDYFNDERFEIYPVF